MAKKRYYDGKDGMIKKDMNAQANMPQQSIMKPYPKSPGYLPENLNDGLSGIDSDMKFDNAKKMGNLKPEKF